VILATLIGFALQTWAHVADAAVLGLAFGMLASLFVPTGRRSCPIR
jgi:hypothetical protein